MSRTLKKRTARLSVAVIVDGEDEKWYVEKVKAHYPCPKLNQVKVKPELPYKKKVQELFLFAEQKLEEGYSFALLVIDLDSVLKDKNEWQKFKEYYTKYQDARNDQLKGKAVNKFGWMRNLCVIVNNPCLEYWYLLHFGKTTKFYPTFDALLPDLRKKDGLSDYQKSASYYNQSPDIYIRLEKHGSLPQARRNASPFSLEDCENCGGSEMNLMFDYFDTL